MKCRSKYSSSLSKKLFLIILAFSLVLSFPTTSFSEDLKIYVVGDYLSGYPGDTVSMKIKLSNVQKTGIYRSSFNVYFDNGVEVESVKEGEIINNAANLTYGLRVDNVLLRFNTESQNECIMKDGVFAVINFKIKEDTTPGEKWMPIRNCSFKGSDGYSYSIASDVGGIKVLSDSSTAAPTSKPINTPTSTSTATTRPTDTATPKPTDTLKPTETPKPTVTPTLKPTATATAVNSNGNGLSAVYFGDVNLTQGNIKLQRVDPQINFNWNNDQVISSVASDWVSVRWTGYIVPRYSEEYTIYATADDGVRVWINGNQLIDEWNDHQKTEYKKNITLNAGQKYPIKVEYYEASGEASIDLSWSSNRQTKEIIPKSQLFSDQTTPTPTKATATATSTSTPTPKLKATSTPTLVVRPTSNIPAAIPGDLSIALTSDKSSYEVGQSAVFSVYYKNRLSSSVLGTKITVDIPYEMSVEASSGGIVSGKRITWDIGTLKGLKEDSIKLTLKVNSITGNDKEVYITAAINSSSTLNKTEDDKALARVLLFKQAVKGQHNKYVNGYPDNTFKPENKITRAEISSMLASVLELDDGVSEVNFKDVNKSHWAYEKICTVVGNGLFEGEGNKFRPNDNIKRGELAAVIFRCLKIDESYLNEPENYFMDTKGHWAQMYIEEVFRNKIIMGDGDKFRPNDAVKRSEAVAMINRMLYRGPLTGVTSPFKDVTEGKWYTGHILEAVIDHKFTRDESGNEVYLTN